MDKEKILKLLKSKIGIGVISGVICFALGGAMFSDSKTVAALKQENSDLVNEYNSELADKDTKINELQSKVDEAKPWFDKQEEERKAEEAKLAEEKAKKEAEALDKGVDTDAVKQTANSIIKKELDDQITDTILDELRVNENSGTDSNKDVIVLANLTWRVQKVLKKTTIEMLEMYSDRLAAKLAPELAEGSEIALFWNAEYTGLNIKYSYYVKNGNAYRQQ